MLWQRVRWHHSGSKYIHVSHKTERNPIPTIDNCDHRLVNSRDEDSFPRYPPDSIAQRLKSTWPWSKTFGEGLPPSPWSHNLVAWFPHCTWNAFQMWALDDDINCHHVGKRGAIMSNYENVHACGGPGLCPFAIKWAGAQTMYWFDELSFSQGKKCLLACLEQCGKCCEVGSELGTGHMHVYSWISTPCWTSLPILCNSFLDNDLKARASARCRTFSPSCQFQFPVAQALLIVLKH